MKRIYEFGLFSGVRHEIVDELTLSFPHKTYRRGEALACQGSRENKVILLLEGRVQVVGEAKAGKRTTIIFHEAPYIFGHIEVWKDLPNLGSVIAMEKCEAVIISKKEYFKLLQTNHQVAINMVKILSNLLYRVGQDEQLRLFGQVDHLVANTLCSYAHLYGEEHGYGVVIRHPVPKSELAEIVGVARKSIIEALKLLVKDGVIEINGQEIVIPNVKALQTRAHAVIG